MDPSACRCTSAHAHHICVTYAHVPHITTVMSKLFYTMVAIYRFLHSETTSLLGPRNPGPSVVTLDRFHCSMQVLVISGDVSVFSVGPVQGPLGRDTVWLFQSQTAACPFGDVAGSLAVCVEGQFVGEFIVFHERPVVHGWVCSCVPQCWCSYKQSVVRLSPISFYL